MTNDQLEQARQVIVESFQKARPQLTVAFGRISHEMKSDATPVTVLDKQVEEQIRAALSKFDPGIGFEGEEFGKSGNEETFWLIDPIDGTEAFIRGLPISRNMITLIDKGQPVMTLVYKFMTDELFEAVAGKGATCNGQPIHVSTRQPKAAWIEISTPFDKPEIANQLKNLRPHINGYCVMRDFTLVASGKLDGHIVKNSGGGPWDYAPRALLIQEAGGRVANIGTTTYDFRNFDFIAANPSVFDTLMEAFSAGS